MTNDGKTMQFGVHLLFDGYGADPEVLADRERLRELLIQLPLDMEMHPISEEIVVEVGELNEKDPGGVSGFVMIAESHISFHTFPNRGFVTADVYTCQNELDTERIIRILSDFFRTTDIDAQVLPRGVRYPANNL